MKILETEIFFGSDGLFLFSKVRGVRVGEGGQGGF